MLPKQLYSVLDVEHRGSMHLRTPDTGDAKGTPNRKEDTQTKQAQREPGGLGSRQPGCPESGSGHSIPFLAPAGAIMELRSPTQGREEM